MRGAHVECILSVIKNAPLVKSFIKYTFLRIFQRNQFYLKDNSFLYTIIALNIKFDYNFIVENKITTHWWKNESHKIVNIRESSHFNNEYGLRLR